MRRSRPRAIGTAVREARGRFEPATPLSRVQAVWRDAAGPAIAASAEPVAERDGTVTIACASAVWAQELDLLRPELATRLNRTLAEQGSTFAVRDLKITADLARFCS